MKRAAVVTSIALALALVGAGAGCRDTKGDDAETPDAGDDDPKVDAPPGVGCTATTPRAVPLESFIGPTGLENRLKAAMDSATSTLDVQMYLFTVDSIKDRIIAAKQRGVAVRVILDPDETNRIPDQKAVKADLEGAGVTVRFATMLYTYSHAKYVIADGATAWIMSTNFNYDAMSKERNYGVVDKDPEDVADLHAIFEMDWAAASGGADTPKPANLACTRLVVSPTNSFDRIRAHINSAKSTLEVEVQYLSETSVLASVIAAKNRGVTVRVIVNPPDGGEDPGEPTPLDMLKANGIPVKEPKSSGAGSFYLHAKLIIADGVPFVGSENMSYTSLNKNREVGVLVLDAAAQAPIKSQFETDWTASVTQ